MDHLYRELAPISEAAWEQIESSAKSRLVTHLAARKLVDLVGPHGWSHSATDLGRVDEVASPAEGVAAVRRRVLPLVELRADFAVSREELDDADRGSDDIDLPELDEAVRQIALAENSTVFHGYAAAGMLGITESSSHEPLTFRGGHGPVPQRGGPGGRRAAACRDRRPLRAGHRPGDLHRHCGDGRARRAAAVRPPAPDPRRAARVVARCAGRRRAEPARRRLRARERPGSLHRIQQPRRRRRASLHSRRASASGCSSPTPRSRCAEAEPGRDLAPPFSPARPSSRARPESARALRGRPDRAPAATGGGVLKMALARLAISFPLRVASTTLARRSVGCDWRRTRPSDSRSSTTTVAFGGSMPSSSASSRMDMERRATRRMALIRPKLRPTASATSRRRSLSSTRSHMRAHTSRAAWSAAAARGAEASVGAALGAGRVHAGTCCPSSISGLSSAAVRCAVASAQRDVATKPRIRTTAPQPARVHQAAWLATARPGVDRDADPRSDQRADHGHAERLAHLARGGGDGRGHPGLGPRHPRDGGVGDGRVDQTEAESEDHVGGEEPGERGDRIDARSA